MKPCKTIIINGRKLLQHSVLLLTGIILTVFFFRLPNYTQGQQIISTEFLDPAKILSETVPLMKSQSIDLAETIQHRGRNLLSFLLQFDLWNPTTVLASEIPLTEAVNRTGVARLTLQNVVTTKAPIDHSERENAPAAPPDVPPERQAPIKEVNASQKCKNAEPIALGNETSYQVDPIELLQTLPSIRMSGNGPKVLVIHTHATEAYAPEGATIYDTEGNDRSENTSENVVKVGEVLSQILEGKGIETIHDTKLHDTPSFNGSYASSLKAMEFYLAKYPSIQVILDLHRDSIVYEDGTKAQLVTEINGRKAAQLMFVVGTDQKGLEHPHWRENIKSAIHFQNAICKKYPTLMRHINLRRERFNGHTGNASMIIEVGSSGNSLSEAIYGITLAGNCIADYLNGLK